MRVLLATMNPGKVRQIREYLMNEDIEIVTTRDIGVEEVLVEETGSTFEENARLKARGFFEAAQAHGITDVAVLGDDGGIMIDALNGAPGVYAKRWVGEDATDEQIIAHTMKQLEGVPKERRTARFRVTQVLLFPDGREELFEGCTEGWISLEPRQNAIPGLPYRGILIVEPFGRVYDQLTHEEQAGTHRVVALEKVKHCLYTYVRSKISSRA